MIQLMGKTRNLRNVIAQSIKDADNSYFFEDYTTQAHAVLKAIKASGYRIVPETMEKDEFKTIANSMKMGKMPPEQHVENLYHTFIAYWEKTGK